MPASEVAGVVARARQALLEAPPAADEATCEVSVVFPCLDEADAVGDCVRDAAERLEAAGIDGEVVVCDNGSRDGSEWLAEQAGARVVHEERPGYGSALMGAIAAARGRYIVMLDADGSYDLDAVGPMLAALRAGADLVLGNRFRGRIAPGAMPWAHRHIGNPFLSALLNVFFGTRVGDVHCGMRAFTREAYHRLALKTTGMEFASEMVARAARIGLRIAEVPVDYHPRAGASKLRRYRDGWRHLRFLLMYSPTWLYMVPSVMLFTFAFTILLALAASPIAFMGRLWDMHLAAIACLLSVLATQGAWLGISARTLAVVHGFDPTDEFISGFYRHFTLERGLALAGAFVLGGSAIGGWVVWRWVASGFPPLDEIRPLLLAVTLIIVGFQGMFNAFFLSLLSVETRAVEPS